MTNNATTAHVHSAGALSMKPAPDDTQFRWACSLRTIHALAKMRFNEYTTLAIPTIDAGNSLDRRLVGE
jgi:hypothetical protein